MKKKITALKSGNLRLRPMSSEEAYNFAVSQENDFYETVLKNNDECVKNYEEKNRDYFFFTLWDICIIDKTKSLTSIGKLFFHGPQEAGSVEISIYIDKEYQNSKYGTRALKVITDWAFYQRNVYEINAHFDDQNSAAINAFTNAGYVFRENVSHTERYSITKDPTSWRGLYMIIGVWVGCIIAMIINHIIIGVLVGIFLGFALGFWLDSQDLKRREEVTGVKQKVRKKSKDK